MATAKMEDISGVKKRLLITLSKEEVAQEYQTLLRNYTKAVKIKGFRPGKAPVGLIEMRYGKEILEEARDKLIQRSLEEVLQEKNLTPVGVPSIERGELKKDQEFSYLVQLEIKPTFELPQYKGIEIEKEKPIVTDEMVEKRLRELQIQYGKLEDVLEERPIQPEDKVVAKCKVVRVGGEPKEEEERVVTIDLGDENVESVWPEELVGKMKGDGGEVKIRFPAEHPNKELAGKEVSVRYEIMGIKRLVLPELDDDFARRVSSSFQNLSELTERIRKILNDSEKKRVENEATERLLGAILDQVDFELPESLVTNEINAYIQNMYAQIKAAGGNPESVLHPIDRVVEELRPKAERGVKEMLVLADIAKKEGIEVDQQEMLKALEAQSAISGESVEALLDYYRSRGLLGELRYRLLREKTLKYLLENAKIQEHGGIDQAASRDQSQHGG